MKKLLALLMAMMVLVGILSGCGEKAETPTATTEETETAQEAEAAPAEETEAEGTDAEEPQTDLLAEAQAFFGDAIDYTVFDEPDVSEDSVDFFSGIELDQFVYTVEFADGSSVQVPNQLKDMEADGWICGDAHNDIFPAGSTTMVSYSRNGVSVSFGIINRSEEDVPFEECWVTTVYTGASYNNTDFSVHGISMGASVADVVAALGQPYYIYYGEYTKQITYDDSINGTLDFILDEETGLVTNMRIYYFDKNIE